MVADELVWQKRMAVVQSTLLLLCLGLVLFVRSGTLGSQSDMPIVQTLGSRYSRFFDTPPGTPDPRTSLRRPRSFRNIWRNDTWGFGERGEHHSDGAAANSDPETDGHHTPLQAGFRAASPGTPSAASDPGATSTPSPPRHKESSRPLLRAASFRRAPDDPSSDSDQARRVQFLATQSGPATPNGTRDVRPSWEEVERAVDRLVAEERQGGKALAQAPAQAPTGGGQAGASPPAPLARAVRLQVEGERSRKKNKKKRSPLRRAHSYGVEVGDGPEVEGSFAVG